MAIIILPSKAVHIEKLMRKNKVETKLTIDTVLGYGEGRNNIIHFLMHVEGLAMGTTTC